MQAGIAKINFPQVCPIQVTTPQLNSRKIPLSSSIASEQLFSIHNTTPESLYTNNNSTHTLSNSPGLLNSDFDIANPDNPNYGWNQRGAATILNSKAILTENSPLLSNFSQTFIIPEGAKTLQFTLTATELGHSHLAPPDAFEVALLEANTLTPLVGTSIGLSQTDSFFNLQANGTAYFNNFVKSNSTTPSGRTISVDISHLSPGTLATLYFDLLGFGKRDSRIEIDRVRILTDSGELAPEANNDTATTPQSSPITLNVLANDSDADGTIDLSTLQLVTPPNNGTLILKSDRTFTYTPNNGFVGTDSFTYTIQDNDGLTSLPAIVTINVTNIPPKIDEIEIEDSIIEGTKTTLSAIATDIGNDILTYTWNISDGTNLTGQQIEHTFADNGTYTATITVTDVHGASSTKTFNLVVNNSAPIVSAGEDITINEGQLITLEGNFDDLGINDTHTMIWDFGNGTTVTNILTPTYTYTQNGTYTATLTVSDDYGATNSDSLTVTVNNLAPTITAITGETTINQGETAFFSATAFDPGLDPLTYTWNFGNSNQSENGQNVTYTLTQAGTYELNLTVTDDEGAFTTQTRNITVNNLAPVITKIENTIANEGEITYFSAIATDLGNDALIYTWNFGDGSQLVNGQNITHTYINSGNSNVTLTVTDQYGASTTQTLALTINNLAPTITQVQGNTNLNEGETASFSAIATDPGNDPITYIWNFSDGSQPSIGHSVSHQFINNGIYIITLTATDSEGASTTQSFNINVNNLAPIVEAGENQTIYSNETITFNGSFSDPGLNDTHTLTWDFGDGTSATNIINPTHRYTATGTYNVTFTVIDDFGATSEDTL
ncbi:PKD domain-containing protein, partial [Aphanothece hegewaldii]